jgi:hypothetical protein
MELTIKVLCKDLPGKDFGDAIDGEGRHNVHVGIQCCEEVIDIVPGDAKSAEFAPVFKVAELPGGLTNFTGPFAKGTKDQRFFYLSWGELKSIHLQMFRLAALRLGQTAVCEMGFVGQWLVPAHGRAAFESPLNKAVEHPFQSVPLFHLFQNVPEIPRIFQIIRIKQNKLCYRES